LSLVGILILFSFEIVDKVLTKILQMRGQPKLLMKLIGLLNLY